MDAKIWVLLALLTIVNSRDLILGSNNSGHKIFDENKKANPALWRRTDNVTIAAVDGEVISKLIITDLRDEKDGDVKIVDGGEGQQNVTVELNSPTVLRGYDFHIEAFAVSNNEQASLKNGDMQKALNNDETNTSPKTPITPPLFLSSSSDNPVSSSEIGKTDIKRQHREVEKVDKSTQQPMHPIDYTSTTIKTPQMQSTVNPNVNENKEDKERTLPAIYGIHVHDKINPPSINIQEPSKISESTARYTPSTKFETIGANHNQEGSATNNDMLRHTSVDYPKFYIHEINTAAPTDNKNLNVAENNTKNENFRQKRDVVDVKSTGTLKDEAATHTSEKNESNNRNQNPLQENINTASKTGDTRKFETNKNFGHAHHHHADEDTKLAEEQNRPRTFRGRHVPQRFGFNSANKGIRNSESSLDVSKTSTPLPTNTESKSINDKTNAVSVSTFTANEVTTIKAEITTANKQVADSTDKIDQPAAFKENERQKRDVKPDKIGNKETLKDIIEKSSVSTSTIQPSIIKNTATDDKNADEPSKLEIPTGIDSAKDTDKKNNLKTVAEGNKNNDNSLLTPNNTTTTKSENKNREHGNIPTTEKQENVQEPVRPKSEEKISLTVNTTEQNERITRDTDTGKKSDKVENEKISSTIKVAKEAKTEKGTKEADEKTEKSLVPVMIGNKDQKTAADTIDSSPYLQIDSKNSTLGPNSDVEETTEKDKSPKLPREVRKVDLKDTKASLDLNKENIGVSADSSITKDLSDIKIFKDGVNI